MNSSEFGKAALLLMERASEMEKSDRSMMAANHAADLRMQADEYKDRAARQQEIEYDDVSIWKDGKWLDVRQPCIRVDRIPEGGSAHPERGFRDVRCVLDAQGNPIGWGMACGGGCENLCKVKIVSFEGEKPYESFEHDCAECKARKEAEK